MSGTSVVIMLMRTNILIHCASRKEWIKKIWIYCNMYANLFDSEAFKQRRKSFYGGNLEMGCCYISWNIWYQILQMFSILRSCLTLIDDIIVLLCATDVESSHMIEDIQICVFYYPDDNIDNGNLAVVICSCFRFMAFLNF